MIKDRSFALEAKEEAIRAPRTVRERKALLYGFLYENAFLRISSETETLDLSSESSAIIKGLYEIVHDLYGAKMRFSYTRSSSFKKRMIYHVLIGEGSKEMLEDLSLDLWEKKVPTKLPETVEEAASFITGAFLASGSVNDPSSSNYHFEIAVHDKDYARYLRKVFLKRLPLVFEAKIVERRTKSVVYLKKADDVSNLLILMEAKGACLLFENERVDRDFANIDNRLANLGRSNFGKTMKAAERQLEAIRFFKTYEAYEGNRNPKVLALMRLREEHEEASLEELADYLSEELGSSITKSNVNHMFRRLVKDYEEYRGERKE